MRAVDLFAGPGGWDVGARELGIDPLGIEWDDAACRVREAAGLRTLQADVAALDPLDFPCDLLIASPPCTAFSMAGKGEGRRAIEHYRYEIGQMAAGEEPNYRGLDEACGDESAHLVLEPLRWALATRPGLLCCEQVPPVLPLWEAMADVLHRLHRYHVWTGLLSAERYATPQTRQRAFLIASLHGPVGEPPASHQRYVAPRNRDDVGGGLFDLPEAERVVAKGDEHLPKWVSMAEALGWQDGPVPSPAPTVTSARSAEWAYGVSVAGKRPRTRPITEPAPSITGAGAGGLDEWVPAGLDRRQTSGRGEVVPVVPLDRPAPTMTVTGLASGRDVWVGKRPATTVAGDPRISHPGGHTANDGRDNSRMVGRTEGAVRVTIEQAACLQGFPDNYPWQAAGSRSAAFRCIGNAVPPPLARAVMAEALASSRGQVAA